MSPRAFTAGELRDRPYDAAGGRTDALIIATPVQYAVSMATWAVAAVTGLGAHIAWAVHKYGLGQALRKSLARKGAAVPSPP